MPTDSLLVKTHSYGQYVLVKVSVIPGAAVVAPGAAMVVSVTETDIHKISDAHTHTQGNTKAYFLNIAHIIMYDKKCKLFDDNAIQEGYAAGSCSLIQVVLLSLTNPRDALHRGKRPNL